MAGSFIRCFFLTVFIVSTGSLSLVAQTKVVERSAKKTPKWYGGAQSEYIITSTFAPDLEQAKQKCLELVKIQVVNSVAENFKTSSESTIIQSMNGSELKQFIDSYVSSSSSQSANMPFIKGISASKIEDFYWEKHRNKKTKEISYLYAIKYPFPALELKKLIRDFTRRDNEMEKQLNDLQAQLTQVVSVEQIEEAIAQLSPLIDYFFDPVRKQHAVSLQASYRDLFDRIVFSPVSNELGTYCFQFQLDGRPITTSQQMVLRSNCASQLNLAQFGDTSYCVYYHYDDCLEFEENWIELVGHFGPEPAKHRFFFDVKEEKLQILPSGSAYLKAAWQSDQEIEDIQVRMNLSVKYANKAVIRRITLNVPDIADPIVLNDQNIVVNVSGDVPLEFTVNGKFVRKSTNRFNLNHLKGVIQIYNEQTGDLRNVDINVPYNANWNK